MDTRNIVKKDPADFTPTLGNYKDLQPFRFWCQKVLPLVYDDSLSYYELLCKVVEYLNKTMEDVGVLEGDVTGLHEAYVKLQTYVNDYFSTLDVQEEINNKLDEMVKDGTFIRVLSAYIPYVTPEMYGAIGDGITNDYEAFKSAINSGFLVVGSVNKKYLLNNEINCDTLIIKNVNIICGDNVENTLFTCNNAFIENSIFTCRKKDKVPTGIVINNGYYNTIYNTTIDGFAKNLVFNRHEACLIDKCKFHNWNSYAILATTPASDTGDSKIINSYFSPTIKTPKRYNSTAICLYSGGGWIISNNKINWLDNEVYLENGVVWFSNVGDTSDIVISNNSIENCTNNGITINNNNQNFQNIVISNNEIASYTSKKEVGISITGSLYNNSSKLRNVVISNNIVKFYDKCIRINRIENGNITGNTLEGKIGVEAIDSVRSVISNNIYDCSEIQYINPNVIGDLNGTIYRDTTIQKIENKKLITLAGFTSCMCELQLSGIIEGNKNYYYYNKFLLNTVNTNLFMTSINNEIKNDDGINLIIDKEHGTLSIEVPTGITGSMQFSVTGTLITVY